MSSPGVSDDRASYQKSKLRDRRRIGELARVPLVNGMNFHN
jgi:hypothetical protein